MNFTKMVESELLALKDFNTKLCITDNSIINEVFGAAGGSPTAAAAGGSPTAAAGSPPTPPTAAAAAAGSPPTPPVVYFNDTDIFLDILLDIANNKNDNGMNLNEDRLSEILMDGAALGKGGLARKPNNDILRDRAYFPILDLGYTIWTGLPTSNQSNIFKDIVKTTPKITISDLKTKFSNHPLTDLRALEKFLNWDRLATTSFTDFEESDFKNTRLRQLFHDMGNVSIRAYHDKNILSTLLEITKIRSKIGKFPYNEKQIIDIIQYPLDYARGAKSLDVNLSSSLLHCVESIISWYIDHLEKDKLIDKPINEDASLVGSKTAKDLKNKNQPLALQDGYIQLLNGNTDEIASRIIPSNPPKPITKGGVTPIPDKNKEKRRLNTIITVQDCKSTAPQIYNAIAQYSNITKPKKSDFAERFKTAGQAFGGIFTT